ncbi:MAG: PQQ-dependent sugar dehydrogenase [Vicinamibacterales bacterium]
MPSAFGAQSIVPGTGEIRITRNTRLQWSQSAETPDAVAALGYVLYVDEEPADVQTATCTPVDDLPELTCDMPLPPITTGSHTLAIAAVASTPTHRVIGPRSDTLRVRVESGTRAETLGFHASSPAAAAPAVTAVPVADGLHDVRDMAALPDGRLLIAERGGSVRVWMGPGTTPAFALVLDDVVAAGEQGLLSVAVDPAFASSHHVFLLYSTTEGLRVARFEETRGRLHSRAILLDALPAVPDGVLRFGPDGRLYVALGDGGHPDAARDRGTLAGKLLRVNPDGTSPDDQPPGLPIRLSGLHQPTGMAWNADGSRMWVSERTPAGGTLGMAAADGRPAESRDLVAVGMPPGMGAASVLHCTDRDIPSLDGTVLVAADRRGGLLQLTFDADGRVSSTASLLDDLGAIRSLAAADTGRVYVASADRVWRLDRAGR